MPRKQAGRGAAANANGGKAGGRKQVRDPPRTPQVDDQDSSEAEVQVTRQGEDEEGAAQALTQLSRGDAPAERPDPPPLFPNWRTDPPSGVLPHGFASAPEFFDVLALSRSICPL